jgi:branched-chain amino acid transport system permease protein
MDEVAQQLVNALAVGGTYALLALGLAVVFNMLGFVNFAHGELLTIAAFTVYGAEAAGLSWLAAAPRAGAAAPAAGVVMERTAFRPVRRASANTLLLTSFAISVTIQGLLFIFGSPRPQAIDVPNGLTRVISVGPISLSVLDLVTLVVTTIVLAALALFFRRSDLGIRMRAAADDFDAARMAGIDANAVVATAFALSGALAGVAALIWTARLGTVEPSMGLVPMLKAFIAAVMGGLGSIPAAAVGGFVLGGLEVALQAFAPEALLPYRDALAFGGVVLFLLVWPNGILRGSS